MMQFTNLEISLLEKRGSGARNFSVDSYLRGITTLQSSDVETDLELNRTARSLRLLGAVLRALLLAAFHTGRVQRAANDVVANTRKIAHAAASHEHDRMLLEVVLLARDVGRNLLPGRELHARDLPQRRVRLLGCHDLDLDAH